MSTPNLREIHAGDGIMGSIFQNSRRVGIPHRIVADVRLAEGDEVVLRDGDILEIIHRWDTQWWMGILDEDDGVISSELLEPLSGSVDVSIFSEEIPGTVSSPLYAPGRKLVALIPHQLAGRFATLEPPPVHTFSASILTHAVSASEGPVDSLEDRDRAMPLQVRALVDVTAREAGDLSYQKGDIIDVELRGTAEVWRGRLRTEVGDFRLDQTVEPIVKERVRAIWDYSGVPSTDLTFKAGDIIEVCGPSGTNNWWFHGWMPSRGIGMFPYNFVESLEDEFPDAEEGDDVSSPLSPVTKSLTRFRVLKDVSASEGATLALKQGDIIDVVERQSHDKWLGRIKRRAGTFSLDNSVEPIMTDRVKAIFSFQTLIPEELSFEENDCITVVAPSDESTLWWYGTLNGRVGLFPFNYIELLPDERDPTGDLDDWVAPQTLRALHSFSSKDKDVLNFDANDIIRVVDASSGAEWWTGELYGRRGLFPRAYCEDTTVREEKVQELLDSPQRGPLKLAHGGPTVIEPSEYAPQAAADLVNPTSGIGSSQRKEAHESGARGLRCQHPSVTQSIPEAQSTSLPGYSKQSTGQNPQNKEYLDRGILSNAERVRALHHLDSRRTGELVLRAGDMIQVLARPWEHWWKGRLERNGDVGLFPTSYVEAVPLRRPKRQSSLFDSDEAVLSLQSNIAGLFSLLQSFDLKRDLAESVEIQELFKSSCILRRKVLRLLVDTPHDDDLKKLDSSFQEMKAKYDSTMELCVRRALEEDAKRTPTVPKSITGLVTSSEPESKLLSLDDFRGIPISEYNASIKKADPGINGGSKEGSKQRASLPPTPAPDSSSSEAWSSSLANILDKRRSKTEPGLSTRYSGRLSGLEADIRRAKKAYQASIRSQEEGRKPRRLPTSESSIAILRSVRDKLTGSRSSSSFNGGSDMKTIHLPRVEYIHNHVVYENQHPVRRQRA